MRRNSRCKVPVWRHECNRLAGRFHGLADGQGNRLCFLSRVAEFEREDARQIAIGRCQIDPYACRFRRGKGMADRPGAFGCGFDIATPVPFFHIAPRNLHPFEQLVEMELWVSFDWRFGIGPANCIPFVIADRKIQTGKHNLPIGHPRHNFEQSGDGGRAGADARRDHEAVRRIAPPAFRNAVELPVATFREVDPPDPLQLIRPEVENGPQLVERHVPVR